MSHLSDVVLIRRVFFRTSLQSRLFVSKRRRKRGRGPEEKSKRKKRWRRGANDLRVARDVFSRVRARARAT